MRRRMDLQLLRTDDPRRALRHELQRFFDHRGLTAWIGSDVMIVQGDVALHADVAVTIGADPRVRRVWITESEGRSIDVAFRLVNGQSRLAALTSAARHVELGAVEGFAFHPREALLWGFHRPHLLVDAMPSGARGLRSRALGAELVPTTDRLRIVQAGLDLSTSVERLSRAIDRAVESSRARAIA